MEVDQPRYLGRALGYTTNVHAAVDELEALGEAELEELAVRACRRERARRRDVWLEARRQLVAGVEAIATVADPAAKRDVRLLRLAVRRLDSRFGA